MPVQVQCTTHNVAYNGQSTLETTSVHMSRNESESERLWRETRRNNLIFKFNPAIKGNVTATLRSRRIKNKRLRRAFFYLCLIKLDLVYNTLAY